MKYRIYDLGSAFSEQRYLVKFKFQFWPFWFDGVKRSTLEEARRVIEFDKLENNAVLIEETKE